MLDWIVSIGTSTVVDAGGVVTSKEDTQEDYYK